jgi:hypothetical protein
MDGRADSLASFGSRVEKNGSDTSVPSGTTSGKKLLTNEERKNVLGVLDNLRVNYQVNLTKLSRRLGKTLDIKQVFLRHSRVPRSLLDAMAAVLDLTVAELFSLKSLPLYRVAQLRDHLRNQDLMYDKR